VNRNLPSRALLRKLSSSSTPSAAGPCTMAPASAAGVCFLWLPPGGCRQQRYC